VNINRIAVGSILAASIGCSFLVSPLAAIAADSNSSIPSVIEAGFAAWAKVSDTAVPFNVWKKGGLMENDSKVAILANYFQRIQRTLGKYKSYEPVEAKKISQHSQIIYLAINFERGAVYGRFLVYRTDNNWVVQNMDFSTQPEAVMPWLTFAGGDYGGE
jgi:hypothetical protein